MIRKNKRKICNYIMTTMMLLLFAFPAYALEDTKIVTGTKMALSIGTSIITGFGVASTIFAVSKDFLLIQHADSQEKELLKKKIKGTVAVGVLVLTCGSFLTAFFALYL